MVPANGVFNEYVYYYFKSIKDYAESVATGTTFKELSGKAFSVLPVPLPPLNEQKRIVTKIEELFSELDAGEESFKQARKQLGIYRQSLLKQAFEGKLTEAWRKANPDQLEDPDQLLARIQQERESRHQQQLTDWQQAVEQWEQNGKEGKKPSKPSKPTTSEKLKLKGLKGLPGPWSWCSLQSLLSFGPKNGYSPRAVERTTETKAITLTATTSGTFDNSHFKYLDLFIPEKSELWLKTGDILLQRGNTIEYVGVPALYKGPSNQFTYPDLMMKLQTPKSVSSEFLTLAISDRRARVYMHERASGAAGSMPKINQGVVNSLPIPLCSLPEQQEIVRLLEEQFTVIEQNEREIDAALKRSEALRQSILKRAFSGQLVPQDPTDEPASQLLARIQTERTAAEKSAKVKKKATKKVARKRAKK